MLKERKEQEKMQREQKKIVMEEKIQEWLNMKKEQVDRHCFKPSNCQSLLCLPFADLASLTVN